MSLNTTSDIVAAVRRSIDSGEAAETAFALLYTARTLVNDDNDPVARTFFARLLLKIAGEVDPDVLKSPTTLQ